MPIYETHCHLNHKQFLTDWLDVLNRAREANVRRLLVVGYDLDSSRRAVSLAASVADDLRAAVGIHPEAAAQWNDDLREELLGLHGTNPSMIRAWGEIGLDYHWKTVEPHIQKRVFSEQLLIAKALGLPVVVHCRDAYDDTIDVMEECGTTAAVLHCFTGDTPQVQRALALGYSIGVGGVVTYKNSHSVREMVKTVPLDRILLETDSPYLAPQAWRGKRNEPAYLTAVVAMVSDLFEIDSAEIEERTWQNAVRLFG